MKSGVLAVAIICVIVVTQTNIVYAGGYEIPMLGSRVLGMGGAFIGTADDWTAIYWNPAGLTQQQNWGLGVTLFSPHYTLTDGNSVSNYDAPQMSFYQRDMFMRVHPTLSGAGNEDTQFSRKTVDGSAYCPGIGSYWAISEVGVIGLGFYMPVGNLMNWDDAVKDSSTQADITASYSDKLSIGVLGLSFARDVMRNLSAGAGLNLVYGRIECNAEKEYICTAAPQMNYAFDYDSKASGTGVEWVLGLRYRVMSQLSVGAVYRSGSELSLSGVASTTHTMLGIDETSDYTQNFYHPATYGFGLAYKPISKLLLGFDWAQADWTTMKAQLDYENEGTALEDIDKSLDWDSSDSYRLGVEYAVSDRMTVQAGYTRDLQAVPDKGVGLTGVNEVDRDVFSVGAAYSFVRTQIDAAYLHAGGTRTADNVEYKLEANVFILTCSYDF